MEVDSLWVGKGTMGRDGCAPSGAFQASIIIEYQSCKRKHQQSSGDKGQWNFTAFVYAQLQLGRSHYNTQLDALLTAEHC